MYLKLILVFTLTYIISPGYTFVNYTYCILQYNIKYYILKSFFLINIVHYLFLKSVQPIKKLKIDAIPTLNGEPKIIEVRNVEAIERKKLVNKLLADYEEQQKNEGYLKDMVTKYPNFFSPKINPNAKLGDKLKLIKSIDNPQFTPLPKKKLSETTKPNQECLEQSVFNNSSQNKDNVIQVSAVKGGIMLHALPQITNAIENTDSTKCVSNEDEESEEIIIVTEDEAHNTDLSLYEEQQKENNTEIVIVTNLKETEETLRHIESSPKNNSTQIYDSNNKHFVHNKLENNLNQFTPLYTAKVSLNEEKGCQVIIPCKDCEHKSFKINKLLRERTKLLKDLNQNGTWKNPNEINTLKRMNGVLSMLLMQCIGKKPSSIRVDLVQDSIERVDSGWSMQNTSEVLCQALSVNAYDEFVKTFQIINEI